MPPPTATSRELSKEIDLFPTPDPRHGGIVRQLIGSLVLEIALDGRILNLPIGTSDDPDTRTQPVFADSAR